MDALEVAEIVCAGYRAGKSWPEIKEELRETDKAKRREAQIAHIAPRSKPSERVPPLGPEG